MELADAVEQAIRECIAENVLREFLEKHRAEAKELSIFEYDQEKHMRQEREEAYNEGVKEGRAAGLKEGRNAGLKEGHNAGMKEGQRAARLSMIMQMLRNGMSEEDISRIAGASEKEIKDAKSIS